VKSLLLKMVTENGEDVSCMRVMSLTALLIAASVTYLGLYLNRDMGSLTPVIALFLGAAFGGKIAQKHLENKSNGNES
jgi:hypothetical protein